MRIGGIYQPNALVGKYLVSDAFFLRHFQNPLPGAVLLKTDGSAGVQQAVKQGAGRLPERAGPVPGAVRGVAGGPGQPAARAWSTPCSPWPCSSPSSGS